MSEPTARPALAWRLVRWLLRQTVRLLALFGAAAIVYLAGFDLSRARPQSMGPTLLAPDRDSADRVLIEKVSYWFREPHRWEVLAFRDPEGSIQMRRVVGLPGEEISMLQNGEILIDGRLAPRPPELAFLTYIRYGNLTADQAPASCGDGYFVLGDHPRDIHDSRLDGPVPPQRVIGRAWLIIAPDGRRGFVHN
jgi:signal peptidase I